MGNRNSGVFAQMVSAIKKGGLIPPIGERAMFYGFDQAREGSDRTGYWTQSDLRVVDDAIEGECVNVTDLPQLRASYPQVMTMSAANDEFDAEATRFAKQLAGWDGHGDPDVRSTQQPPKERESPDPHLDLITRIGKQMDDMQRSRMWWFVIAVAGWLTAGCLIFS